MPLVELRNVTKRYHKGGETITPLHDVSLDIDDGEFVSLMGASGTGKSTLLNLIASIDQPDSGSITIAGTDITTLSRTRLANWRARNIGYIFQSFHLIPTLTALENVAVPLELSGETKASRRAAELLEAVGLSDRMEHYPVQLSGGEQQRVAVARAFACRPPILLADEPTGNLDSTTGAQVIELLLSLHRDQGTTMVFVTHDSTLATSMQRVISLRDGRLENDSMPMLSEPTVESDL